jgi:hypothetical protein
MTKKFNLINKNKQLVGYKIETDKDSFIIPVVDVRRNEDQRRIAERMVKNNNRSKFMHPSFSQIGLSYQVSRKS